MEKWKEGGEGEREEGSRGGKEKGEKGGTEGRNIRNTIDLYRLSLVSLCDNNGTIAA